MYRQVGAALLMPQSLTSVINQWPMISKLLAATPPSANSLPGALRLTIIRQSRRLYGCWPLKGPFSQPLESKRKNKSKSREPGGHTPVSVKLLLLPAEPGGLPLH
jgi:hypothetical protein